MALIKLIKLCIITDLIASINSNPQQKLPKSQSASCIKLTHQGGQLPLAEIRQGGQNAIQARAECKEDAGNLRRSLKITIVACLKEPAGKGKRR